MGYLGNTPTTQSFTSGTDYFNGTGSQTAFTLTRNVNSVNDIQVTVNNVVQQPNDAYTVSGTTLTMTSAPSSGTNNVYVRYLSTTTQTIAPSSGVALSAAIGTASSPSYSFAGDSNTGIFSPAADTIAFAEGGTEVARIDSSGNVGIGTTAINNVVTTYRGAGVNNYIQFTNATTGTASTDGCLIGVSADDTALRLRVLENAPMLFTTNDTERMRITSGGNVGIGTTNPGYKLSVNGDSYVDTQLGVAAAPVSASGIKISAGLNSGDGGNPRSCILCNTNQSAGSNPFILFTNLSNNTAGSITHTGTTTVAYNTSSDYRLKENIAPMTGALAKVAQLKPCTYTWKEDGTDGQGFIAHELQEVVPECVSGDKDAVNADGSIKPQGVDTSFLVATLTAAIQELNEKVEAQAAEIAALKGANNAS